MEHAYLVVIRTPFNANYRSNTQIRYIHVQVTVQNGVGRQTYDLEVSISFRGKIPTLCTFGTDYDMSANQVSWRDVGSCRIVDCRDII